MYAGKHIGREGFRATIIISVASLAYGIYAMCVWRYSLVEKTKRLAQLWVITVFISVVLNIVLIPKMGIVGGAVAVLSPYLIISIITLLSVYDKASIAKVITFVFKSTVSSIVMAFVLKLFNINGTMSLFLILSIGVITYLSSMVVLNVFDEKEKQLFKELIIKTKRFKV